MIMIIDAIKELGGKSVSVVDDSLDEIYWNQGNPLNITKEQIKEKYEELVAEFNKTEPMRLLREQRDVLITATDWWATSDRTMTPEQTAYRQALRDLPETAEPKLDEDGNLTNVAWPEKPE